MTRLRALAVFIVYLSIARAAAAPRAPVAPVAPVAPESCSPNLVALRGHIYTGDPAKPWVEAFAVCDERIARTGTSAEIEAMAVPGTRRLELGGRTAVPGFNDSHVHLIDGGTELTEVDLRNAKSPQEVAKLIADFVRTQPKGRWILGGFWDHESWPDKTLPTRALIDAVTPDNPVFVQRLDGHMGLANAVALTLAGITRDTPAPEGGAIVRDAAGEPTGILKDNAADLVTRLVPPATLDETMAKARAALKHAASVGITTVQDMTASAIELRAYQQLRAQGELPVRITSHQNHGIDGLVAAGVTTGFGDDWLRIGGIKLFADGSMGSGTAAFFAPYADDPTTSGLLIQSPAALEKKVFDADAAGFQVIVHAIGDRANAVVLDIFEKLQQARGARDRRPRIEHAQVVRDADKLRFAKAGVIASIQPSHCIDDMRWAEKRIGPDRVKIAYDFKSFVDAGARISFGTDWFVEPMNPMLGLYAAVTRQFPDGTPPGGWFPEERLTLQQAIEFYTAGSAYAEFAESRKGRLVPGYLADFVVLSKPIFDIAPRELLTTTPVTTVVGGRIVYESAK
jgi:predicted amidohydrolase YtcJ